MGNFFASNRVALSSDPPANMVLHFSCSGIMSLRWTSVAIMRSQALALGRVEKSLYHLC